MLLLLAVACGRSALSFDLLKQKSVVHIESTPGKESRASPLFLHPPQAAGRHRATPPGLVDRQVLHKFTSLFSVVLILYFKSSQSHKLVQFPVTFRMCFYDIQFSVILNFAYHVSQFA